MSYARSLLGGGLALLWLASGVDGQQVRSAVTPDTITVGDVFRAAIIVDLPSGHRAEFPDTLALTGDLEVVGTRRVRDVETEAGGRRVLVIFPLTAWRPGTATLPATEVRLISPGLGPRSASVQFPPVTIRSVLPADTAGVEPKPLKSVLGANRLLWPWLLLAALVLMALAALLWRLARRRAAKALPLEQPVSPRERALAELEHARVLGLVEAGELKLFYSMIAEALRHYLAALRPAWGVDLTTHELLDRMRTAPESERDRLGALLEVADLVKFARYRPSARRALADWEAARVWVQEVALDDEEPVGTAEAA